MKKLLYVMFIFIMLSKALHASNQRCTVYWAAPQERYYNARGFVFTPQEGQDYVRYFVRRGWRVNGRKVKNCIQRDISVYTAHNNQSYKAWHLVAAIAFLCEQQQRVHTE